MIILSPVAAAMAASSGHDLPTKIVEVSDTLRFYKAASPDDTFVAEFSLTPFRYITQYTNNLTLNASFCFARSIDEFIMDCRNPAEGKNESYTGNFTRDWIIANPFDDIYSNALVKAAANESSRIQGLIFVSD